MFHGLANLEEGFQRGSFKIWTLLAKKQCIALIADKHHGLQRLNVDHHDAAAEASALKHVWQQTETLQSECSGRRHANTAEIAAQSRLLIPIWATAMQTCSKKLYCALLHEQKLFKDWPSLWRGEKAWGSSAGWCFVTQCFFSGLALENNFPAEQSWH